MDKMIGKMAEMLKESRYTVFFSGAGVSTESGLKDFRGEDGLDKEENPYTPEEALSSDFFYGRTEEFYRYYRKNMLGYAAPNACHKALAKLEEMGLLQGIVTQNIDGLHQMAGSRNVVELHGSVHRNFCLKCGRSMTADEVRQGKAAARCICGGLVKPDVVLYGESLKNECIENAVEMIDKAELLIVAGTSLSVYPAAGFVASYRGRMIIMNKTPTHEDRRAELVIRYPVGEVFDGLMKEISINL